VLCDRKFPSSAEEGNFKPQARPSDYLLFFFFTLRFDLCSPHFLPARLTSHSLGSRIRVVRKLTACSAIPALLLAVFYAPLFHVHVHPGEAATIHAHLPELETAEDESVVHMESEHSHANARSIDILTTTAPQIVQFDAALVSVESVAEDVLPRCGFVALAQPRAHSPPVLGFLIPRAPPA
jgi:hypothetical protein